MGRYHRKQSHRQGCALNTANDRLWHSRLQFKGTLRPSQEQAIEIARGKLADGHKRLHVVAPPGTGKTVLGLYLWAHLVRVPAVVLSPNSAIQMQWGKGVDLFVEADSRETIVSTDPLKPAYLTSLTYQSMTLPRRADDDLNEQAIQVWEERLVDSGEAKDLLEAKIWIEDLARHNPKYYGERLAAYCKEVRDTFSRQGGTVELLHRSSMELLHRLRGIGIGMVILDECHHLVGHWGRVLSDAQDLLEQPVVLGLTATPPDLDGENAEDAERYRTFFGPIDFEIPVPAVVKDGFLAPFQDLVYFVRPSHDELQYVANADRQIFELVDELCPACVVSPEVAVADSSPAASETPSPADLPAWLFSTLAEKRLPVGIQKNWATFEKRDQAFADSARRFLLSRKVALPPEVPKPRALPTHDEQMLFDDIVVVLDRFVRHSLRRSKSENDHALAEKIIRRLRLLGVQITERGARGCASPVGRILAYSGQKSAALIPILQEEYRVLGDSIRAVVVTDFEKTSAVVEEVAHLLDEEAGGAVAAFRRLLSDPITDELDPILVTGSSILIDDELPEKILDPAIAWLRQQGHDLELTFQQEDGFVVLSGTGSAWTPRVYVALITHLFQQGITKCLVGTRGLLGEGWDAHRVNVLVDLTTATTSTTVNQLRGRSIRLDPECPEKLADNWDVICIAPEFVKGLDDYHRLLKKHSSVFGVAEDGGIEKGIGHVHAALTELEPEGLEGSVEPINAEMLARVSSRARFRQLWRIGEPYRDEKIAAVEVRGPASAGGFPPFPGARELWDDKSLTEAIGKAVLGALREAGLIGSTSNLTVGERGGSYMRTFLRDASPEESQLFAQAMRDVLGGLDRPRYVVPRLVHDRHDNWVTRMLPNVIARYFRKQSNRTTRLHAVPTVLARNKSLAETFARHWNQHVSPGEVVYTLRGIGETQLDTEMQTGQEPPVVHLKDVFL